MIVVGILGGIASGKSFVADQLKALGAQVLDADQAGHQTLTEPKIKSALRSRWGEKVFDPSGAVDRKSVAAIVFEKSPQAAEELTFLEQITHPRIGERLQRRIDQLSLQQQQPPALVLDAPVMLKAGWDRLCQKIIYVDAPLQVRLARALQRGWTEAEFSQREASQESTAVKRGCAHVVIENSGPPEQTKRQVETFWRDHILSNQSAPADQ